MRAENFVIKGTFFKPKPPDLSLENFIKDTKTQLINCLTLKGANCSSLYYEIRAFFGPLLQEPEQKKYMKKYLKELKQYRDDYPWVVQAYLYPGKLRGADGLFIEITSIPTVFYKITQTRYCPPQEEVKYSFIVITNKEFIEGIGKTIGSELVKEPAPLSEIMKSEISEKLRTFGFDRIAGMLEKSRSEIELGRGGLDELRAAIENFLHELVKKQSENPYPLHMPEKNIEKLEAMGYLYGEIKGLIVAILYNQVYKKLAEKVHKRQEVSLFEARLYLALVEEIIDYLLERVCRYKIKVR